MRKSSDRQISQMPHAARWMGAAAVCLTFALSAHAAPGNGNGPGTQGPAESNATAPMQGQMSGQTQGMQGTQGAQGSQGQMQAQNGTCAKDAPADQALVGKSLTEAKSMLQGCPWRIGMQDGKSMPTTRDHRPDRRTLTIEHDKVTDVTRG